MSFNFGGTATTTAAASTFGTTPSTGFAFGTGDTKPLFGGATSTPADSKPAAFNFASPSATPAQGQTFGGFAFGGAKTTAATSTLFSSPTNTNAGQTAFGAKPLGFGGPPNQTVGSPGFGQPATSQTQSAPFSLTPQQPAAPPAFGAPQTTQAPPAFGTPAGGGGFGAKPASTPTGFGFATPASGFSAAPNAAVSTTAAPQAAPPAFGQSTFGAKPASFSFGSTPAATTASAPSFGTPAQPASAANLSFGGGAGFGAQARQTTLGFGNPATSAATITQVTAQPFGGQPQPTTQATTQPLAFGATPLGTNLSFGQRQPSLSFGQPTSQPASFGATPTAASTAPTFAAAPATSSAPAVAPLSFGAVPISTASLPTLNFGTPASTASKPAALSFGAPSTAVSTAAPTFGTPATTASTGLSFTAASSAAATSSGLNFTATPATAASLGFGTATSTGLGFGTTTSTGLGFGSKLVTSTIAPTSTAPSGITALSKVTTTAAMPTLSTATTTTAAPLVPPQQISSITFAELEENINKWTLDLEEQEKTFINQATQVNAWDRLLIANGEKIVELNDVVQSVKNEQQSLEHELDFVLAQQKELEDLLAPMERQLLDNAGDRIRDPERDQMYTLAENLDSQLKQMSEDLKEVIEHLNETNRSQDSNDPIVQIGRILNTHMSSMQWIDNSIAQISNKLDHLKATHDTLRRDNERSFQLTYN